MRPIDADELYDEIESMQITIGGEEIFEPEAKVSVLRAIEDKGTLDVEPVKHERWIKSKTEKLYFGHGMEGYYDYPELCSRCHYDATEYGRGVGNYCPNCGAKMEFGGI